MSIASELQSTNIREVTFPVEGYDREQVDRWLADARDRLEQGDGSLTVLDCVDARFSTTRFGGYDMDAVDTLIDTIMHSVEHRDTPRTGRSDYGFRPFAVDPEDMTDNELEAACTLLYREAKRRGITTMNTD